MPCALPLRLRSGALLLRGELAQTECAAKPTLLTRWPLASHVSGAGVHVVRGDRAGGLHQRPGLRRLQSLQACQQSGRLLHQRCFCFWRCVRLAA
jgi:hypothetical protein